ncbi:protein kinase [Bordetella sp. H567]|uniref:type II toxin-antitoxin system HipA family toxin n=1 Tax=Bordetella sp. H567 TaxID=1697043 RepID=UPI00081CAD8C|nr:HipA domain-containing protein [Bordetella sp. H567]AOB30269.1 protein kinase [Bordetella sp. H567]
MTISKPLYVYLQRPDTGEWVTVGRYALREDARTGAFRYAPSYIDAAHPWSIDPVNIPLVGDIDFLAQRYGGLHDALRDTCPDSWGKLLLQRQHGLSDNAPDIDYLRYARNGDLWGALAVGTSRKPSIDLIQSPKLAQLEELADELLALYERRPPVNARLRKMLMATPSLGGARPKGTLKDGHDCWLVKPLLPSDTVDIPALEHHTLSWAAAAGLSVAQSVHHGAGDSLSVLRVRRFDRQGERRLMAISGATLLSTEYPGAARASWSYPRMAEQLRRIGAPREDQIELFDRMVFNAIVGNDDDHPRNHAAIYRHEERRWRLSPAFDIVPTTEETPRALSMQLSEGRFDITREATLADAGRFGLPHKDAASAHLASLVKRIADAYPLVKAPLPAELRKLMDARLSHGVAALQG